MVLGSKLFRVSDTRADYRIVFVSSFKENNLNYIVMKIYVETGQVFFC